MASIIEGYNYDIFISYRQKDNKGERWVSEFVDALKTELESTFKEEVSVYFDINPHDGLLETYDISASLAEKLKCIVFIPIISRTYCDPKSFAWQNEFIAFIEQSTRDQIGLKVKLPSGNITTRVLPVKIHELDPTDIRLCETALGGPLRGVDFIFKSAGVNRPLRMVEDNPKENLNRTYFRDQINKVANAIREIMEGIRNINPESPHNGTARVTFEEQGTGFLKRLALKAGAARIWFFFALIVIASVLVALYFTKLNKGENSSTIAFIPLKNYGDDLLFNDASNFIEVINEKLRLIRNVSMASTISMLQYSNTNKSLDEISKELKLDYFLAGSIKRESGKPVIWVELSSVKTKRSLWSDTYTWEKEKIPGITMDLIYNIVDNIDLNLSANDLKKVEIELTENTDANLNYISANAIANDATFYFYYGNKLRDSISFISAIRSYDKAISSDPYFAEAYAKRSIAISWGIYTQQIDSSYIPQCKSDAEKAIRLKKDMPEGQIALGFYYYYCVENEPRKALEHFKIASDMDPEDYHPQFYMALVHRRKGEWDESMKLIRKVIQQNPSESLFLTNIGLSYDYQHKYDSAIIFHQRAIDIMPGWSDAYMNKLNSVLLKNGKTDEAWLILNTAIRKTGQELKNFKILLFMLDENYEKALYEAELMPGESFESGAKYLYLASVNDELKNTVLAKNYYDSAAVIFSQYLELSPKIPEIRMSLAFCYAGSGNKTKALEEAEKAIKLSEGNSMSNSDMKVAYTQILTKFGRYDEALKLIEFLLENPSTLSVKSIENDPVFRPLVKTEKFQELIRRHSYN